jgi:hypothetical protein
MIPGFADSGLVGDGSPAVSPQGPASSTSTCASREEDQFDFADMADISADWSAPLCAATGALEHSQVQRGTESGCGGGAGDQYWGKERGDARCVCGGCAAARVCRRGS